MPLQGQQQHRQRSINAVPHLHYSVLLTTGLPIDHLHQNVLHMAIKWQSIDRGVVSSLEKAATLKTFEIAFEFWEKSCFLCVSSLF